MPHTHETLSSPAAAPARTVAAAPRIAALRCAFPEHVVTAEDTARRLAALFPAEQADFIEGLVHNSGVSRRRVAMPVDELLALHDFTERNRAYRELALEQAEDAARAALDAAGMEAHEVDALVDVSCTGICLPALDVDLSARLGLRPDVQRLPVTEAGCAGGVLGMGVGSALAAAGRNVLVLAVELCTVSFVPDDTSRSNLIAGVLFGDGAGAAVLRGDGRGPAGAGSTAAAGRRIVASGSHLFPGTRHAMGFDVGSHGLRLLLDRSLPALLRAELRPAIDAFLARHGLTADDIGLHLVHTGGKRVLQVYEELFGMPDGGLLASRAALQRWGNLSSASIFTVFAEADRLGLRAGDGRYTLAVAFGPGLSAEFLLLEDEA